VAGDDAIDEDTVVPLRSFNDNRFIFEEVDGGVRKVHRSLGNRTTHPFSDFLMHDIRAGDGNSIQPTPESASRANQIRTARCGGSGRATGSCTTACLTRDEAILSTPARQRP
jgi:hypothetical protein